MAIERSGAGAEPDRLLAMLWRHSRQADTDARPALGRRPRLNLDAVVAGAIELADAEGIAATSMSRVAGALGVGTMTLYTYVPSKAELVDLMVDTVLGERPLPGPGEPRPANWRDQVQLYVEATVAMYRRHPWLRHVSTVRPPTGPGTLAEQEYVLSTLEGTGLRPDQMPEAATAITVLVRSAAALEVDSEQLERATGQTNDAWWGERMQLWEEYFDVDRHPTMSRIWAAGGFRHGTNDGFVAAREFGVRRLLDGIEALANGGPVK